MKNIPTRPDESTIQAYLLGNLPVEDALQVERYAAADAEFGAMLDARRAAMDVKAQRSEVVPPPSAKAKLFQRPELQQDPVGRLFPPYIHSKSTLADFEPWIGDAMQKLMHSSEDFDCVAVGASDDTVTMLARMCSSIPTEVHSHEVERVMLVEGYCDFVVGNEVHHFGPGDRYQLPLHVPHSAHVTTEKPCIFIVQRTRL